MVNGAGTGELGLEPTRYKQEILEQEGDEEILCVLWTPGVATRLLLPRRQLLA